MISFDDAEGPEEEDEEDLVGRGQLSFPRQQVGLQGVLCVPESSAMSCWVYPRAGLASALVVVVVVEREERNVRRFASSTSACEIAPHKRSSSPSSQQSSVSKEHRVWLTQSYQGLLQAEGDTPSETVLGTG